MKVEKIVTETEELEITGATLLSVEEAERLPLYLQKYRTSWWLRSPGYVRKFASFVYYDGIINSYGVDVDHIFCAVRPALSINFNSSNLKIGDKFIFDGVEFKIISNDLALCLDDIGKYYFRADGEASDANDYEVSDIMKFIDEWFEKETEDND